MTTWTIDAHRQLIDRIDDTILALVKERLAHNDGINYLKTTAGLPTEDRVREREILERLWRQANDYITPSMIYYMMTTIINLGKSGNPSVISPQSSLSSRHIDR